MKLTVISSAKLSTIEADLRLRGEDYNTAVSILNVGFVHPAHASNFR